MAIAWLIWQTLPAIRTNYLGVLDGGSFKNVIQNEGNGEVKINLPYLIFHHAVVRKAESAIREGHFKLVKTWNEKRLELFELSKDLSEGNDLSEKMPEKQMSYMKNWLNF